MYVFDVFFSVFMEQLTLTHVGLENARSGESAAHHAETAILQNIPQHLRYTLPFIEIQTNNTLNKKIKQ